VKPDACVVTSSGRMCGKVRSVSGNRALGLLRVPDVIGNVPLKVTIDEVVVAEANTYIPSWWPLGAGVMLQQSECKDH
jgi:hypothetical protein